MSEWFEELKAAPAGVSEVEALLRGVDDCLMVGFSRLGQSQLEALSALARAFIGSPLEAPVSEAVDGIKRAEFREAHFKVLASARAALQGAQHDALLAQARQALGRPLPETPARDAQAPDPGPVVVFMESTRQWLMEVALGGFAQLDGAVLTPFIATLEQLHEDPQTLRLGMLLTGIWREWMDALPIVDADALPARRWADLWTRAMIGATGLPAALVTREVTGTLKVLGCELRHHPNAVSAVAHGVLSEDGQPDRLVRATISSYKVDVVVGAEMWRAFDDRYAPLVQALSAHKTLKLTEVPLRASGDLILDSGEVKVGAAHDPLAIAREVLAAGASAPVAAALDPLQRHPALIAEPVYLDDLKVTKGADGTLSASFGEQALAIDHARMAHASPLAVHAALSSMTACFGLLRYDGGAWWLQPLLASAGEKVVFNAQEAAKLGRSDAIATLQERASKLLRR